MKKQLIMIGNGSVAKMAKEIVELTGVYEITAILDDKYEASYYDEQGIHVGPLAGSKALLKAADAFFIAVGSNEVRQEIFETLNQPAERFPNLIHPAAIISPNAKLGYGNFVMAGAVINVDATVKNQCIVNSGCIIGHDAILENFSQTSPGTVITGYVYIDEGVNIGANVTVIPSVEIGAWAVIGAGSTVIRNVEANTIAVGSPAKFLKEREVRGVATV